MPNQILRQEINILDAVLSAAGGSSATSNEIIQLDTTQYTSPTYYFEVVADSTISITFTVTLRRSGTSTDDATCTIPLLTTSFKRIRSASFTPPAGQTNYVVQVDATAGATKNVNAARIIIIQNAGAILGSETQIEIGNNEAAKTNTAIAALTNPKYWLYTAANWGGTMTCYAEVVSKTSAANTHTVRLEEDDGAFANWTTKVTIVSAVSGTTVTRRRSASFVPTDGRHYRISALGSTTKSSYTIYCAKIIIDCSSCDKLEAQYLLLNTGDSGTGQQFMQTLWDATEWNDTIGGVPVFKYSHDASNASDSSKLIDIDNGNADVTGATVTGTNQQISAAFTMPTTGHQVDVNVTNSTGVVAATRVLALYSKVFDISTMALFRNIEQPYFIKPRISPMGAKNLSKFSTAANTGFYRSLTLDQPASDLTGFPVLFSGTYSYLATVANGGKVQNANGYDIAFYSDSGLTTLLPFERVYWNATTGNCEFWINVPTLTSAAALVIYIAYGSTSIITDQQNVVNTWNTNYSSVWHFPDGTTLGLNDSTGNGVTLTNNNVATAGTGQIDGAVNLVRASSQSLSTTALPDFTTRFTFEGWINTNSTPVIAVTPFRTIFSKGTTGVNGNRNIGIDYRNDGAVKLEIYWTSPAAGTFIEYTYTVTLTPSTWYHLVIAIDWSTNPDTVILYLNGISQSLTLVGSNNGTPTTTAPQTSAIGSLHTLATDCWDGLFDEFRTSTSVRVADWVAASYSNQNDPANFYIIGSETPT